MAAPTIACSDPGVERTRRSPKRDAESFGDADDPAIFRICHESSVEKHPVVRFHGIRERAVDRAQDRHLIILTVRLRAHETASSANTSRVSSLIGGYGDAQGKLHCFVDIEL